MKAQKPKKHLKGFSVLPVSLNKSGSGTHHLYYKKHSGGDGEALFVGNVPFGWASEDLQQVFSCFGEVSSCVILEPEDPSISGAKRALVSFEDPEDFSRALTANMQKARQPYQPESLPCGMQKWLTEYQLQRPPADKLQMQVDRFMEMFDQRANKGNVTDEDGWTTVAATTKRRKLLLPKGVAPQDKKSAKKKKATVVHFYKHEERTKKQNQLEELRKKFEEDKAKLAQIKSERKGLLASSFAAT